MRTFRLCSFLTMSLVVSACADIHAVQPVNNQVTAQPAKKNVPPITPPCAAPQKKNPLAVSFYPNGLDKQHNYTILGKETVPLYNTVGIKRQTASIHDSMRQLAAGMGGDAVIDIQHGDKTVTGTIVAYQHNKENTLKS